jgi:hypothetical protein
MKANQQVECLLRKGHKPKELQDLGFSKHLITRVKNRLKEEKAASELKDQQAQSKSQDSSQHRQGDSSDESALGDSTLKDICARLAALEALPDKVRDLETRLSGTPLLGLKRSFQCQCGASGMVSVPIKCTSCGVETSRGWFPIKNTE